MADPKQPKETMENLAQNLSKSANASGKFESSTKQIMKQLTKTLYPFISPKLVSLVTIGIAETTSLMNTIANININDLTRSTDATKNILSTMKNSKATAAFHPQYEHNSAPLINEAQQRQVQKDELENAGKTFIKELQSKFGALANEKDSRKLESEIRNLLSAQTKDIKTMQNQAEKLEINVEALQKNLTQINKTMFKLLPVQDRKELKVTTPSVAEVSRHIRD